MEWKWLSLLLYCHYNRHCTSESVCEYVYVCISLSLSSSSVSSSACLSFRSAIPFARDPTPDEGGHPHVTVDRKKWPLWLFRRKTSGKMNFLEIWYWWSPWSENFFHLRETIDKWLKISIKAKFESQKTKLINNVIKKSLYWRTTIQ